MGDAKVVGAYKPGARDEGSDRLAERNRGRVGVYFRELLEKKLGQWERWVLVLLIRSLAYGDDDLPKLLELAKDVKATHEPQIEFIDKYTGDLFLENAAAMEREVNEFLDREILPSLEQLVNQAAAQEN